jgi:hypothetical protein
MPSAHVGHSKFNVHEKEVSDAVHINKLTSNRQTASQTGLSQECNTAYLHDRQLYPP